MTEFLNRMKTSKTFWVGLAGVCTAVGMYVSGEFTGAQLFQAVLTAGIGIFLKDAVAKK